MKETVVPKEETNATGEQESGNTGTVTTIVTEQQGSSEKQQTELSASTQFNIISTGLVLRENQTKKVMPLMLLLMVISSSTRLIDDSLDSLKEQYDKWREKFSLRDTDLDDLIEEIPLQEGSAIVIPFPELGDEYMMEALPLAEPETVVISNPLPEPKKEGKIEQIPIDEDFESSSLMKTTSSEGLTDTQKSVLNRLKNTINDHLTELDFSGTLRDLQGNPVPNGNGGYFDHVYEMKVSYHTLSKIIKSLTGSLNNPNLSEQNRVVLEEALEVAQKYASRIEEMFLPYGGIR